jgi:hypothetical protein
MDSFSPYLRRAVFLFPLLALAGCGGGGTNPDPPTNGPTIIENALTRSDFRDTEDDRYYDIYICDAPYDGDATVEMRADAVDSYLVLYRKNSDGTFTLIDQDDDSGDSAGDAFLSFPVRRGRSYRIVATSSQADERGPYLIRFSEELGRPARVLPDGAPSAAHKVDLPPLVPKVKVLKAKK